MTRAAIIILALLCAGCTELTFMVFEDANGCQYAGYVEPGVGTREMRAVFDATGKQVCRKGAP